MRVKRSKAGLIFAGGRKPKPRGAHDAERNPGFVAAQFKKGDPRIPPGGKPRILQKFSAMFAEELCKLAPAEVSKSLGFKKGATNFQVLIAAQVRAAQAGDVGASREIRETLEGKLPTKNLSLTLAMEAFAGDPNFRKFMEEQYQGYLQKGGTPFGATETARVLQAASAGPEE